MRAPKTLAALCAALLFLTACAAPGQAPEASPAPAPEPESPASVSEPAPSESSSWEKKQILPPEPDEKPLPPQGEVNPDFGMGDPEPALSSDPVDPGEDDVLGPLLKKEEALQNAVDVFFLNAPEDAYSYQRVELTDVRKLRLEVGILDEAAMDRFLAGYAGEPWDELVKKPGLYSVAKQNEFVKAVRLLEPEPGAHLDAYFLAAFDEERFTIDIYFDKALASPEEAERWARLPQALKDLAADMGIAEEALDYMPPRYTPAGLHPD